MSDDTTQDQFPKLCECGCGQPAPIAKRTYGHAGHIKGQPVRFIKGHGNTKLSTPTVPNDLVLPPDARIIPLSQGQVAIVDECHYEWLNQWNWQARKSGTTFYAQRAERLQDGKKHHIQMHRLIMDAQPGVDIDHIDGNGCNNMAVNLRLATKSENSCNKPPKSTNTSGYKGVSWHKGSRKWVAYITAKGKTQHLGSYDSPAAAASAYDEAARKLHGKFARLNFGEHP